VPRHRFVRLGLALRAYGDASLPIGPAQSISQPTFIARCISLADVQPRDRVLEIGTGSGYTAAVLARLAREVVTVERVPELAAAAAPRLAALPHVKIVVGDGWRAVDGAFDAIVVMCGAPSIPTALTDRLADGGRLVVPVGERTPKAIECRVVRITRRGEHLDEETAIASSQWNALVGRDGWGG
jgi:protein-L-isoaspartate(D-aspartate) O-methyltransferase